MTQPLALTQILNHQKSILGKLHYSETASTRLASKTLADLETATDCSGNIAREFQYWANLYVGTYTGNMVTHGASITQSKADARTAKGLLPGDAVFFDFDNVGHPTHVALYAGNGEIYNHGGPGNGPAVWNLRNNVDAAHRIWVRRYIQPTSQHVPSDVPNTTEDDMTPAQAATLADIDKKVNLIYGMFDASGEGNMHLGVIRLFALASGKTEAEADAIVKQVQAEVAK